MDGGAIIKNVDSVEVSRVIMAVSLDLTHVMTYLSKKTPSKLARSHLIARISNTGATRYTSRVNLNNLALCCNLYDFALGYTNLRGAEILCIQITSRE